MLEINGLEVNYGAIVALKGVDLKVNRGEIVTMIGANGAGKSTTMNTAMGLVKSHGGKISYEGKDITNANTKDIVKQGMVLVPEGRQVFPEMSVRENLEMGGYLATPKEREERFESVYEMFPKLKERRNQAAGTLSGGEQQMLAVGRALMAAPKLILMDEPSLGLAPFLVQEIFQLIVRIKESGTSVLLVEQNARMALKISDRAYVLETGKIVLTDTAQKLLESDMVRKAYLGG
ncbi:MAG TPA: ABC transporter ATP-binding protein [Candidatus Eisenbergiella pullicola]|nr:ABC transporter ATP-binding protein [Candidatus Eisenbergiella pullicola]